MPQDSQRAPLLERPALAPFPLTQVLWLSLARGLETGSYIVVFPICPDLVHRAGVRQQGIGFYVGCIEAVFAISQALAMLLWPKISANYGNKVVLLVCLTCTAIGTVIFGLSQTVWQMIAIRALLGVFAASELTVRTMVGQIVTKEQSARAYSFVAVGGNIPLVITPAIVGMLYDPFTSTPWLVRLWPLLATFPALLPAVVFAIVILVATFIIHDKVEEVATDTKEGEEQVSLGYSEVLRSKRTRIVITAFGAWFWLFLMVVAVGPTFFYTDIRLGGWGYDVRGITRWNVFMGVISTTWTAFGYHRIMSIWSVSTIMAISVLAVSQPSVCFIVSNTLLRAGRDTAFAALLPPSMVLQGCVYPTLGITLQLALNNAGPSTGLAARNALGWCLVALAKAVVPAMAGSLFALSVDRQILDGHVLWVVHVVLCCFFAAFIWSNLSQFKEEEQDPVDE